MIFIIISYAARREPVLIPEKRIEDDDDYYIYYEEIARIPGFCHLDAEEKRTQFVQVKGLHLQFLNTSDGTSQHYHCVLFFVFCFLHHYCVVFFT